MKIYALIFATGDKFMMGGNILAEQAKKMGVFTDVFFINSTNYPQYFKNFLHTHSDFINNSRIGYGYYLWKPFIVHWHLENVLKENDILIYMDAGCEMSIYGKKLLLKYIQLANLYGGVFFKMTPYIENHYTKQDLINLFNANAPNVANSGQIMATFFLIKNTKENQQLILKWLETGLVNNYHYIDDSPSIIQNAKKFIEHRWDQSILSLLVKLKKTFYVEKYNSFAKPLYSKNTFLLSYPIHIHILHKNTTNSSFLEKIINDSDIRFISSPFAFLKFKFLLYWYYHIHVRLYNLFFKKHPIIYSFLKRFNIVFKDN